MGESAGELYLTWVHKAVGIEVEPGRHARVALLVALKAAEQPAATKALAVPATVSVRDSQGRVLLEETRNTAQSSARQQHARIAKAGDGHLTLHYDFAKFMAPADGRIVLDATLAARVTALDVHPTGPSWGAGTSRAGGRVAALEAQVAAGFAPVCAALEAEGVAMARRPLRVAVRELAHEFAGDDLLLRFRLAAGSFATTVLREVLDVAGDR